MVSIITYGCGGEAAQLAAERLDIVLQCLPRQQAHLEIAPDLVDKLATTAARDGSGDEKAQRRHRTERCAALHVCVCDRDNRRWMT